MIRALCFWLLALAAVRAAALARRLADHRPIAWVLTLWLCCALGRAVLALARGGTVPPFAGAPRLIFHAEQILALAPAFLVAWLARAALRRGPAPEALVGIWLALWVLLVALYPGLRGAQLRSVYSAVEFISVAILGQALIRWTPTREPLTPAVLCCWAILAVELATLCAGPWVRRAPLVDTWHLEQIALVILFLVLLAIQILWTTPSSRSLPRAASS